ncbi:hypothetical protein PHYSODRAFT_337312 [Phytophthora sojae]|uniref:Protein kinase domain-containing protein n=1 Tax=Phytophthora sojae (strain P6497) TaxID=1094619 RepID=G5A0B1_PHYSP|nr:hypothetical protein PHYSODRAFT_337312 [Phytophthora sojae]EGZ10500.1 hypothetical protein PHYSODRAFT_337312 [Phytophthora sojae]|eukprot:XP_009533245.1 hypothetical protein PHYSODRAFT_337312 [Phytophthora sojae]
MEERARCPTASRTTGLPMGTTSESSDVNPYAVYVGPNGDCTESICADDNEGGYVSIQCSENYLQEETDQGSDYANSLDALADNHSDLWDDEVIIAKRIPRNQIKTKELVSRGAFGDVYVGKLYHKKVVVKMLLPGTRTSLQHVNDFLAKAKISATLDHPHIVKFLGVTWDSLSNLCIVSEFMDGGDLRSLIYKHEMSGHPVEFNKQKATIALQVCYALTYLHSLAPPIIHRDVKPRNILLSRSMNAMLTNFGVGIFSFGVILSELDMHTVPYAILRRTSVEGHTLPAATLLQGITMGSIRVDFSEENSFSITCVSVDPSQRPTAAEALALTCTPQMYHNDPVCVKGVAGNSVSDCTNYNRGGWDDYNIASNAFNGYSYLGVETYIPGRCGVFDSIASAKLYRLDENCYPNAAGTESHRLTLGHSATITTYSDATCSNVAMTTTVRQAAMGASRVGFCIDEVAAFFGGTKPDFAVVAIYDAYMCMGPPTSLKFSQDFTCQAPANAPCQATGSSRFSVSTCTSDFLGYAAETFGANAPYVVVQDFPNPWCNDVEFVTVYSADGSCYTNPDDATSFRARINAADGTATITTFTDRACNYVASDSGGWAARHRWGEDHGRRVRRQLLFWTRTLGAAGYSVSDCSNYNRGGWDDLSTAFNAFDGYSYLGVETYVPGRCGVFDSIASAKLYRLDENCYPNAAGTASHRLTLGHSATITTYTDATCSNVATTTTVRQAAMGASRVGFCVDEVSAFFGGTQPNLTAVAVYDDNTCSGSPSQLKFSQDFACQSSADAPCQSAGGSHFSVSGCASDFFGYAATAFGADTPYLVVEDFANPWCNDVEFVTIYTANGVCHTNADDQTSFRATINTADSTASITTFSDPACDDVASDTSLDSQTLSTSPCLRRDCEFWYGCGQRFAVGGLGGPPSMGKKTAVVEYVNSSCSSPAMSVSFTSALTCAPQTDHYSPTCVKGAAAYSVSDCVNYNRGGWDDLGIARDAFNGYSYLGVETDFLGYATTAFGYDTPYLVVEDFPNPWCNDVEFVTIYTADGSCHSNSDDQTSFRVAINTADGTASYTTYSDPAYNFVASDTYLDSQTLSSSPCLGRGGCEYWYGCGRRYAVGGLGGPPALGKKTALVLYEDNWCAVTPVVLTISSTFQCTSPAAPVCDTLFNGPSTVYQARECINSTDSYVATKFQATPYLIAENYANGTNCQVQTNITMYAADGKCHLSISDGTYFTITQRTDGAVIVSNYPTSLCKDTDAVTYVLDYWNVNTGTCMGDRIFRTSKMPLAAYVSTPATTTPSTWTPTPTPAPIT